MTTKQDITNSEKQAYAQYDSICNMLDALDFATRHENEDLSKPEHDMREVEYQLKGAEESDTITGYWTGNVDTFSKREFIEPLRTKSLTHWFFEDEILSDEQDTSCEYYQLDDDDREMFDRLTAGDYSAEDLTNPETCRERIEQDALSIEVRSDWESIGEELKAGEYRILLCTGGPAVMIQGDLSDGEPSSARLMHQDWGTPWTQLFGMDDNEDRPRISQDRLLDYARVFCWEY